jgi:hypothetical protein
MRMSPARAVDVVLVGVGLRQVVANLIPGLIRPVPLTLTFIPPSQYWYVGEHS